MNSTNDHASLIQSSTSGFLVFVIVTVLFLSFYMTGMPTAYSVRIHDPDFEEASFTVITSGNAKRRISLISLGFFWALLFIRRKNPILPIRGPLYWSIILYISWSVLSISWADDPQLVLRRAIVLIILSFSAFSTSINVPLRQLPTIILWTSLALLMIGVLSEIAAGVFSLSFGEHRFAGTIHPNNQGRNCAMLFLAAIVLARREGQIERLFFRSIMVTAFFFLLLTRSRATFVATIIAVVVWRIFAPDRSKNVVYLYFIVLFLCIGALVFSDAFFPLLSSGLLLGREEEQFNQLNGRIALWAECIEYGMERPLLGYGFHGFWTEDRVRAIAHSQGWSPHASHSTYVENFLNLGLVGLAIFMVMVTLAWWAAKNAYRRRNDVGMGFALALLTLWLAGGLLARPVGGLDFLTYLFLVVLFGVARSERLRHHVGNVAAIRPS